MSKHPAVYFGGEPTNKQSESALSKQSIGKHYPKQVLVTLLLLPTNRVCIRIVLLYMFGMGHWTRSNVSIVFALAIFVVCRFLDLPSKVLLPIGYGL